MTKAPFAANRVSKRTSMAPQEAMEQYHSESSTSASWTSIDFDSSWDDFELGERRGRPSHQTQAHHYHGGARSGSDERRHHFIRPQYSTLPPDIRRTSNSPSSREGKTLNQLIEERHGSLHRLPTSDPLYHDVEPSRHARSLSPQQLDISLDSTERLNLFPSPMRGPSLHRSESIKLQAERAVRSFRATQTQVSTSKQQEDSRAQKSNDSLLMFADPEDARSVMTGMSQQELINRRIKDGIKRKDKKYRKQKEKKSISSVRILNLPASLKGSGSPSKRKYQRKVGDDDPEQAPAAISPKHKNLLSRYSRSNTASLARLAVDGVDRRMKWGLMSTQSSARSVGLESTQSSQDTPVEVPEVDNNVTYAFMPINPSQPETTKNDILAQAAENWLKSIQECNESQASVSTAEFDDSADVDVSQRNDVRDFADGFDQNSTSTNGSDDDRPTEEDGAFPSLSDARQSFAPTRLSFEEESVDEAQWAEVTPKAAEWFEPTFNSETRTAGTWDSSDKLSEESPVSVMAVHGTDGRLGQSAPAVPAARNKLLLPPSNDARRPRRRPRSILRMGRHSGAKEVAAKIKSVKSARVQFHEKVIRAEFHANDDDVQYECADSYQSSHSGGSALSENCDEKLVAATLSPQDWADLLEKHTKLASAFPESLDSLQANPSEPKSTDSICGDDHYDVSDREWILDGHEHESFGDFGSFADDMDKDTVSEEDEFIQTVAAIVIQTAARRMLAVRLAEGMLVEMHAAETAKQREAFLSESEQRFPAFPSKNVQMESEGFAPEREIESFAPKYDYMQQFVPFPPDKKQPTAEVSRLKTDRHADMFSSKSEEYLTSFPSTTDKQNHEIFLSERADKRTTAPVKQDVSFASFPLDGLEELPRKSPQERQGAPVELRDIADNPSVNERREQFSTTSKTISTKQKRDLASSSSEDKLQLETAKQERDLEILPSLGAHHLQSSPSGSAVHLEAVPYHMYDIAATQIQSTFRGWWVRDSINVDHFCACRIQRAYRSYRERTSFVFDIYRIAIVQSLWRRKIAQRKVEKMRIEIMTRDVMPKSTANEDCIGDSLRIRADDDAAATTIQSLCRVYMARTDYLEHLMNILLVQSIARRWLAKRSVASRIAEERGDGSKVQGSAKKVESTSTKVISSIESPELKQTVAVVTPELHAAAPNETIQILPDQTPGAQGNSDESRGYHRRVPSEASEADAGVLSEEDQKWVKVSDSYDEESFLQSYASKEKSAAVSLESKDKTEVTKLSADEVIELFIHMSTNGDTTARDVTPLRMESPVNASLDAQGAASATNSPGNLKGLECRSAFSGVSSLPQGSPRSDGIVKLDGRPPRIEKLDSPIVDKEVLIAKEKADRMNARLSMSAVTLWSGSKNQGTKSESL